MRFLKSRQATSFKFLLLGTMICFGFIVTSSSFTTFHVANAAPSCVSYDSATNTIFITCDANFTDVRRQTVSSSVLKPQGGGSYILNAAIVVKDGATFSMSSSELIWLKISGQNSITVYGKIMFDGVKITSWSTASNSVIQESTDGTIPRAWILLYGSEGGHIRNSEITHLGYETPTTGRGGLELHGSSHDFEVSNSDFHHMWMAFYSNNASNVRIDSNDYHDNLLYALDPHTGTHGMQITNNQVHDNKGFGIICSLNCYDILIDGNDVYSNGRAGIMLSRNTYESVVSNNKVHDHPSNYGIFVSQSPNNQIHDNILTNNMYGIYVKEATSTGNNIEHNTVDGAKYGMVFSKATSNTATNNAFDGVSSYEYFLTSDAKLTIDSQEFSSTEIRGQIGTNYATIQNSGTIKVGEDVVDTNTDPYTASLSSATITIDSVSANTSPSLSAEESETTTAADAEGNTAPSTSEEGDSITGEIDSTSAPANDDINNSNNDDDNNNNDADAATNSPPIADEDEEEDEDDATMD
jgi:poly(beta-D-mannuronate) C5 epimerase